MLLLLLHRAWIWGLHVSWGHGGPRGVRAGVPVLWWLWRLNKSWGGRHHLVGHPRLLLLLLLGLLVRGWIV